MDLCSRPPSRTPDGSSHSIWSYKLWGVSSTLPRQWELRFACDLDKWSLFPWCWMHGMLYVYLMWWCLCLHICKLVYMLEVLNRKAEREQKWWGFSPSVQLLNLGSVSDRTHVLPRCLPWWQGMSRSILFFPALCFTALHAGWLRNE